MAHERGEPVAAASGGSTPSRYQRSRHPTANEWRRQCSRGGATPSGTGKASSATSRWKVWLALPGMHAAPAVEGEQRPSSSCRRAGAALDLVGEQLADARPVRDQAALAELAAPHDQQLPLRRRRRRGEARTPPRRAARARSRGRRWRDRSARGRSPCGLSGSAAAASSSRRAWATSKRNGSRRSVSRRRIRCSGETCRRCWVTAQSRKQPRIPTRWLKLRARVRGREATNSSSRAGVSCRRSATPWRSAKASSRRRVASSVRYLRPRARLWARKSATAAVEVVVHASTSSPSPRATSRSASTATLA